MTKKNFIALADWVIQYKGCFGELLPTQIEELADFCQVQNPKFNRERWLGYIAGTNGKNGGKSK